MWLTVAPSLIQPGLLVYSMQTSTTQLALGRQIEEDDKTVCEKSKQFFCSEQRAMGDAQAFGATPTAITSKRSRMVGFIIMVVVFDSDDQIEQTMRLQNGESHKHYDGVFLQVPGNFWILLKDPMKLAYSAVGYR